MSDLQATGLCPVCRCDIENLGTPETERSAGEAAAALPRQCVRCATWYHQDCWDYGGGCSIFGCAPAAPKPCPAPRPAVPLWERLTAFGISLSTRWAIFLFGTVLGLFCWMTGIAILVVPLLCVMAFGASAGNGAHTRVLRAGVVLGPVLMFLVPSVETAFAPMAVGMVLAGVGYLLQMAQARPHVTTALGLVVMGTLGWSHAPDQVPVPFTIQRVVPRWAAQTSLLGTRPRVIESAELSDCWAAGRHLPALVPDMDGTFLSEDCGYCRVIKRALATTPPPPAHTLVRDLRAVPHGSLCPHSSRIPEEARVVVFPRGAERIRVARVLNRVRITYILPPTDHARDVFSSGCRCQEPAAVVLPPGRELVELIEADTVHRIIGPRLDDLVRTPARPAAIWTQHPLWSCVADDAL